MRKFGSYLSYTTVDTPRHVLLFSSFYTLCSVYTVSSRFVSVVTGYLLTLGLASPLSLWRAPALTVCACTHAASSRIAHTSSPMASLATPRSLVCASQPVKQTLPFPTIGDNSIIPCASGLAPRTWVSLQLFGFRQRVRRSTSGGTVAPKESLQHGASPWHGTGQGGREGCVEGLLLW
jgi:hypothetical protein